MVAANKGLHRTKGLSNLTDIDSINWYQSIRGMPRGCDLTSRSFKKRFHRSDFWNQRQREVLQGIDNMKLCDRRPVHVQNSDFFPNSDFFQNSRKMKRSRCYICYTRGHAYWNCPNKNRRGDFKRGKQAIDGTREAVENCQTDKACLKDVIGSDGKGWNEIWYVSDKHPRHMTPNLEVFESFKRDLACSSTTSKDGFDVQGFGDVMVRTESHKFVIPGAFYVPNTSLNILSLSQLILQGFEVDSKGSKCVIRGMLDTSSSDGSGKGPETGSITENEVKEENMIIEEQEKLDLDKEKAIRAIMRYYDSLYFKDTIIEEGEGNKEAPSRNDFESLIGFLHMIHEQEIIEECKGLVAEHFEKLVKWFYKDFMHCEERPTPVKIGSTEICLLDLYLTVKGMGGHARMTIKNKWIEVARAMGFPKNYADGLKECYGTHLSLLAAYYEVAKHYPSDEDVPKAAECGGTSGIKAVSSPEKETTPDCMETKAKHMWEHVKGKGMKGKVEFDDGENLIISFEEDTEVSDDEGNADQSSSDDDKDMAVI